MSRPPSQARGRVTRDRNEQWASASILTCKTSANNESGRHRTILNECGPILGVVRTENGADLWNDLVLSNTSQRIPTKASPMHRCLCVREVVDRIVASLEDASLELDECEICSPKWFTSGASTLVPLSRTCKSFSDAALNSIWHRQHGLTYLMMCLPRSKWRFDAQGGMKFGDDILEEDWVRVKFYAPRIRHLRLLGGPVQPITVGPLRFGCSPTELTNILRLLASYNGASTLFTQLRSVDWSSNADSAIDLLPAALFGPQLRTLEIGSSEMWQSSINALEVALAHLPRSCPELRDLTLRFAVTPQLAKTVAKLDALHTLNLGTHIVPQDIIRAAASLPHLHTLHLCAISEVDENPSTVSDHRSGCFPALQVLHVVSTSGLQLCGLSPFSLFLRKWAPTQLTHVHLRGILVRKAQDVSTFIETLSDVVTPDALKILQFEDLLVSLGFGELEDEEEVDDDDPALQIGFAQLQPLLVFSNLEVLEMDSSVYGNPRYILQDDDFGHFVAAWPKLKTLRFIDYQPREEGGTMPSLTALSTLAAGCPSLETIGFNFDASDAFPTVDSSAYNTPVNTSMRLLDVCQSRISDAKVVAEFLGHIFPHIGEIVACTPDDAEHGPWSVVGEAIKVARQEKGTPAAKSV